MHLGKLRKHSHLMGNTKIKTQNHLDIMAGKVFPMGLLLSLFLHRKRLDLGLNMQISTYDKQGAEKWEPPPSAQGCSKLNQHPLHRSPRGCTAHAFAALSFQQVLAPSTQRLWDKSFLLNSKSVMTCQDSGNNGIEHALTHHGTHSPATWLVWL